MREDDKCVGPERAGAFRKTAQLPEMATCGEAGLNLEADKPQHWRKSIANGCPADAVDMSRRNLFEDESSRLYRLDEISPGKETYVSRMLVFTSGAS